MFFMQFAAKFWLVRTLDLLNMTLVEAVKMVLSVVMVTMFLAPPPMFGEKRPHGVNERQIIACGILVLGGVLFKVAEHYQNVGCVRHSSFSRWPSTIRT